MHAFDLENRYYSALVGVVDVIANLVGIQCLSKSLDLVGILVAILYYKKVGVGLSCLGISAFNGKCIGAYLEAGSDSVIAIDDCNVNVVYNIGNVCGLKFVEGEVLGVGNDIVYSSGYANAILKGDQALLLKKK